METLVSNKDFDDDVEVIISDNCSSDETEQIGKEYASRHANIFYFRNAENVCDSNFSLAMDRSTGYYAKLMNDNYIFTEDGLGFLKINVRKYISEKPALFFVGTNIFNYRKDGDCILEKFEDFVIHLSYYVTAIHCFGAWREDWDQVVERTKYTKLKLNQDDWAYQIMFKKGSGILCVGKYAESIELEMQVRQGYNWFEVHVDNYYTILKPYINMGLVSSKAELIEKRTCLLGLRDPIVTKYLYNILPGWKFDMSGGTKILWRNFKKIPFFYLMMITLPIWGGIKVLIYKFRSMGFIG